MNVLLSIKPRYVERIMKGIKKYEFRKVWFRNKDVNTVYIYVTSPIKKIVGRFEVGDIIEDNPEVLWQELKNYSGIDEREFFSYFNGSNRGVAIGINDLEIFKEPLDPFDHIPDFVPPQSFRYIDDISIPGGEKHNFK